jgi:hypothetical protein
MNDALREAARVDPEWAKKEARRQFILKVTVAGTLLALAIGAVSFVLSYHDAERITHVEQSACQVDAKGHECQQTKAESSRAASIATTCIPFFKAGYPCPKPGSSAAERQAKRQAQAGSGSAAGLNSGSDGARAPQGASAPGEAPATGHHHGSPPPSAPHHHTGHPSSPEPPGAGSAPTSAPAPTASAPSTPSAAPSSPSSPSESQTASTPTAPSHPVTESVGHVVEEVGSTVNGTLCSVTNPLLRNC